MTSLFPLPLAWFLELHFILYLVQCVQQTVCNFLVRLLSVHNMNTVDVTSQSYVFCDHVLFIFAVKQLRIMFTALSIEREDAGKKKEKEKYLTCNWKQLHLRPSMCACVTAGFPCRQQKQLLLSLGEEQHFFFNRGVCLASLCHLLYLHS